MIELYEALEKIEEMSRIGILCTHDVLEEVAAIAKPRLHCAIKKMDSERITKGKRFTDLNHVLTLRLSGVMRVMLISILVKMLPVSVWIYDYVDLFKCNADFKDIFG